MANTVSRTLYNFELPSDLVKDRMLEALQQYFSRHPEFTWKQNDQETLIRILDHNAVNLESATVQPVVSVRRGPISWRNQHIDQAVWTNYANKDIHTDLIQASVAIGCYSRQGLEAERIAGFVFGLFTYFKSVLREQGFHTIMSAQLGDEQILKATSTAEVVMVPVIVSCEIQDTWVVTEEGEELEDLRVRNARN